MFIYRTYLHLVLLFCFVTAAHAFDSGKVHPRLAEILSTLSPSDEVGVWIFFNDKGSSEAINSLNPLNLISQESYVRRLNVRAIENIIDEEDLPVEPSYVEQVRSGVKRVRNISKWFNGVSAIATGNQVETLTRLSFVRQIEPLGRYRTDRTLEEGYAADGSSRNHPHHTNESRTGFDYGLSRDQVQLMNVHLVHDGGNYGQNVIVGVFDNGFRLLQHEAFDSLQIIGTRDFVDNKVSVVPNNPNPGFGSHGVNTLSTLAGFKSGKLIGPAFKAKYLLARTENDSSETPIEEDYWVAAIEWAESLGVQVTSTSLGYLYYDPPYTSWTWQDMDGNTTVITRAADKAVSKGVVVVNSAGNNGYNPSRNTLNAPADGDSVLSIGAVTPQKMKAGFSSVGPTASNPPRIKPDLMAQGTTIYAADAVNPAGYIFSQGTSFSCPLAAGVVALMLKEKPTATPLEIGNALRKSADRAANPNNEYGWGIIDAAAAIDTLLGRLAVTSPADSVTPTSAKLRGRVHPTNLLTDVWFEYGTSPTLGNQVPAIQSPVSGSQVVDVNATLSGLRPNITYFFRVVARNNNLVYHGNVITFDTRGIPAKYTLGINYPNPFNAGTNITFEIPRQANVDMKVFDVLGRLVVTLIDRPHAAGEYSVNWNGLTNRGVAASSGVYLYRLTATTPAGDGFIETRRMTLLR